jgi:hypothetical protein
MFRTAWPILKPMPAGVWALVDHFPSALADSNLHKMSYCELACVVIPSLSLG